MKKAFLVSILSCAVILVLGQTVVKKTTPATKKPATGSVQLKNLEDSANYAMGLSVANFYKQQGISRINSSIVIKAINDVMSAKKPMLDDMQANSCMMTFLNKQQMQKSKPTVEEGETFLAANKAKTGVKTTASGLQYEVLTEGTGPKPTTKDTVVCNYKGTFINGTEFDNSYKRGQPAEFPVTAVIRGWTEVLQMMPTGSKYKVWVPYQIGYGLGDYNGIPGGSMLIFEIELLKIKGK